MFVGFIAEAAASSKLKPDNANCTGDVVNKCAYSAGVQDTEAAAAGGSGETGAHVSNDAVFAASEKHASHALSPAPSILRYGCTSKAC